MSVKDLDWRQKYERMKIQNHGNTAWAVTVLSPDKQRELGTFYTDRDDFVRWFRAPDYRTIRGTNQKKLGTLMLWNQWITKSKTNKNKVK